VTQSIYSFSAPQSFELTLFELQKLLGQRNKSAALRQTVLIVHELLSLLKSDGTLDVVAESGETVNIDFRRPR
jgi:mannose/fructose/N-acetylgalactosamine-specific phosphotransferase system component IIB